MFKKILITTLIYFIAISSPLIAIEPDVFVQSTVNRASKLLSENLSKEKLEFATDRKIDTLEEAIKGADVFIGLSIADIEGIDVSEMPLLCCRGVPELS